MRRGRFGAAKLERREAERFGDFLFKVLGVIARGNAFDHHPSEVEPAVIITPARAGLEIGRPVAEQRQHLVVVEIETLVLVRVRK
jgi:hypothetical protein